MAPGLSCRSDGVRAWACLIAVLAIPGSLGAQPPTHEHAGSPKAPASTGALDTARTSRDQYQIEARRVGQRPPAIDGVLNDEAWKGAAVIDRFTQQEPAEGQPATERTEVRVLYDASHLYIAVRAFDSNPDAIVATEMKFGDTIPSGTYLDMAVNLPLVDPTKVRAPVLMLRGEHDGNSTNDDLLDFYRQLPNGNRQFVILPQTAHSLGYSKNRHLLWYAVKNFIAAPLPAAGS